MSRKRVEFTATMIAAMMLASREPEMRTLARRITRLEDRHGQAEPVVIIHLPPSKPRTMSAPEVNQEVARIATSTAETSAVTPPVEAWP